MTVIVAQLKVQVQVSHHVLSILLARTLQGFAIYMEN